MLAPILLLLSQDPLLFTGLEERMRYFPPVLAVTGYLTMTAIAQVWRMQKDLKTRTCAFPTLSRAYLPMSNAGDMGFHVYTF